MSDEALSQPASSAVLGEALRIRRQGTLAGALALALCFGGLAGLQPLIALAGAALLVVTLIGRSLRRRRALAAMSPWYAEAVLAEMKRGAAEPLFRRASPRPTGRRTPATTCS